MMITAFLVGLLSSFFFAITFVLNRQMDAGGGHWAFTSSLRFLFMAPMLLAVMVPGGRYKAVLRVMAAKPAPWFLWSTVGFGIFYICISAASSFGPAWVIASTWQVTIVAGILLTPLFNRQRVPFGQLVISLVILAGVVLVQTDGLAPAAQSGVAAGVAADAAHVDGVAREDVRASLTGALLVLVAAFAYPLGNRKMLQQFGDSVDAMGRVFGMTLASLPFWVVVSGSALAAGLRPTRGQLVQTAIVALSAGVIATYLFFRATGMVRNDPRHLAVVESTQAGEIVFALLGGVLVYGDRAPGAAGMAGLAVVLAGLCINAFYGAMYRSKEPAMR